MKTELAQFHCANNIVADTFESGGGAMSGTIFISYRRNDSEGEAGRLYDDLVRVFHPEAVFMDVSDIHPGKDFRQAIDENVAKCSVLLAVIGPEWATIKDASGARRLDQQNDFVRLEIASALARGIDVIPVLVHGASMVAVSDLPENLQNLAYRNCVEVTHTRWNSDVEGLIRSLRDYVSAGQEFATRSIRMAITGENPILKPAVQPASEQPAPPKTAPRVLRTFANFAAIAVIAVLGASSYAYIHHYFRKHGKVAAESRESTTGAGEAATSPAAYAAEPSRSSPAPDRSADQTAGGSSSSGGNAPDTSHRADQEAFAGNWINPEAEKGKPMRLEIAAQGDTASIHLWTRNHGAEFDVGTNSAAISGDAIIIQWEGPFSNSGDKHIVDQSVSMRISRAGNGLHMVYSDAEAGSEEYDFVRSE
jgi:TIR domain